MIKFDEAFVDASAPNAEAAKNGRALVSKSKFLSHSISEDETILFGQCQGSGSTPYSCSVDFARPDQPTHRCSCPSRQFPCKHALGLMYAFAQGRPFPKQAIPEDLLQKREKLLARADKPKVVSNKPKQVDKSALGKKIKVQLDGIDVLEKLTTDLVRLGVGNMNAKLASEMKEQAKQLGNAYLPGAQTALLRYTQLFSGNDGRYADNPSHRSEALFAEAVDHLCRLHALIRHGRTYLQQRLDDPDLSPEIDSNIAAWLGHAWQLAELKEAGLVENDVELIQLAFNSFDDTARREYVETGIWMSLGNGKIRFTQNFRPYKAAKYINSDDSFFDVVKVRELCVYPGTINPRIRWDGMESRPITAEDFQSVRSAASSDFAATVKEVKGHLKNPLSDKSPVYALNFRRVGKIGSTFIVEDSRGDRLVLSDDPFADEPQTCPLLPMVGSDCLENQTLIVRFHHDLNTRRLEAKPLSIVTSKAIVRLTF